MQVVKEVPGLPIVGIMGHDSQHWTCTPSDFVDIIARNQYTFQSGVRKVDLANRWKAAIYATIQSF